MLTKILRAVVYGAGALLAVVVLLHLVVLMFTTLYAPIHNLLPGCDIALPAGVPAEYSTVTAGTDPISLFPLGVNCIYVAPGGVRAAEVGPTSWEPTIDASITIALLAGFAAMGVRRLLSPQKHQRN